MLDLNISIFISCTKSILLEIFLHHSRVQVCLYVYMQSLYYVKHYKKILCLVFLLNSIKIYQQNDQNIIII